MSAEKAQQVCSGRLPCFGLTREISVAITSENHWERAHMAHRVLIVDDSGLMRNMIKQIIAVDDDLEVAGEAEDGSVALERAISLDLKAKCGHEILRIVRAALVLPPLDIATIPRK